MHRYTPLILGLFAGVLGGFLAGTLAAPGPAPAPGPAEPTRNGAEEAHEALEARVRELEAEATSLRMTVDSLRADLALLPGGGRRTPLAAAGDGAGEEVEPADDGGTLALTGDPYFDSRVLAVLEAREEAERREREAREAERRERWLDARIARLTEQLGLDEVQAATLRDVLARSDEQRREFFQSLRDSGNFDRAAVAERMRGIEAEARESLGAILTPSQMEQLDEVGFRGGPGGFFGGRRDRGAPPGR